MRKIYESPEAEVVTFAAMEQLALLQGSENESDIGKGPGVSGGVTDREDF
jgi:hypothetical protein